MDSNLKQWRDESEEEDQETTPSAKLPKLHLSSHQHYSPQYSNSTLPLFAPQNSTTTSLTKFPRMGSYFSLGQWQELELQALIFRHMISGADVPLQLLHLVQKSLITSPYYISNHYYPHYQPPLVQSGYWSKAAMDPEPGRCRRTDGKKWRCSRDVVAGQKYCDRHVHRGRNRSRKPVEIPTSAAGAASGGDSGDNGGALKTNYYTTQFSLSGTSRDLLHLNPRPLNSIVETKRPFEAPNDGQAGGGRTLRHFFDDWPRSLHETDNAPISFASATNLSISMPGNSSSDFSLKLGTGDGDERGPQVSSGQRDPPQPNWDVAWETNRAAPMGGPLAEALKSSMSISLPTSVLHRLTRSAVSEVSYVSS